MKSNERAYSAGWEKRIAHLPSSQDGNETGPAVVSASKAGARLPRRSPVLGAAAILE
mgnify:CR=1 FL=1